MNRVYIIVYFLSAQMILKKFRYQENLLLTLLYNKNQLPYYNMKTLHGVL